MPSRKAAGAAAVVTAHDARLGNQIPTLIAEYATLSETILQIDKLRLRFGLSPELAATVALLAFSGVPS